MIQEYKEKLKKEVGNKAITQLGSNVSRQKMFANFMLRHYFPFLAVGAAIFALGSVFVTAGATGLLGAVMAANMQGVNIIAGTVLAWAVNTRIFRKRKQLAKYENKIGKLERKFDKKERKFEKSKNAIQSLQEKLTQIKENIASAQKSGAHKSVIKSLEKDYIKERKKLSTALLNSYGIAKDMEKTITGRKIPVVGKGIEKFAERYDDIAANFKPKKVLSKDKKYVEHSVSRHKNTIKDVKATTWEAQTELKNILDDVQDLDGLVGKYLNRSVYGEKDLYKKHKGKVNDGDVSKIILTDFEKNTFKGFIAEQDAKLSRLATKKIGFNHENYEQEIAERNGIQRERIFSKLHRRNTNKSVEEKVEETNIHIGSKSVEDVITTAIKTESSSTPTGPNGGPKGPNGGPTGGSTGPTGDSTSAEEKPKKPRKPRTKKEADATSTNTSGININIYVSGKEREGSPVKIDSVKVDEKATTVKPEEEIGIIKEFKSAEPELPAYERKTKSTKGSRTKKGSTKETKGPKVEHIDESILKDDTSYTSSSFEYSTDSSVTYEYETGSVYSTIPSKEKDDEGKGK